MEIIGGEQNYVKVGIDVHVDSAGFKSVSG